MKFLFVKLLLCLALFTTSMTISAQLKKVAKIERIKSFTNGSVQLYKTKVKDIDFYYVTLRNNSSIHQPINFHLGNASNLIKNLEQLKDGFNEAEKGEIFEFSANGENYTLTISSTLGMKCYKIYEETSVSNTDYARLYKATIEDMIEYLNKGNSDDNED